jgi:Flp pilus assembly protein TadG
MLARLRARQRARGEDGAALVELAICSVLLITIAFGIVEFGNAWNRKLEVETASRAGARVGSSLGSSRSADQGLLQATVSVLNDFGLDNVNYVVVFNASASNGEPQGTCASSPPVAANGKCNVYTGAQLEHLATLDFTSSCTGSSGSAADRRWCPTDRHHVQASGTDWLGVYVQANYVTATGLFRSPFYLSSRAVMRVEPS